MHLEGKVKILFKLLEDVVDFVFGGNLVLEVEQDQFILESLQKLIMEALFIDGF